MRLGFTALVVTVCPLSVGDVMAVTDNHNKQNLVPVNIEISSKALLNDNKFLRSLKTTNTDTTDDGERGWFSDFAKSDVM